MLKLPLPVKSVLREWRRGELSLLLAALVVAVTCLSAINQFSARAQVYLQQSTARLSGSDAVVVSNKPIKPFWVQKAKAMGLRQTTTLSFPSMAVFGEQLQLVQIKAIESPYPLDGFVEVAAHENDERSMLFNRAPDAKTIWVDARLLIVLHAKVGDSITIGVKRFTIGGVIRNEPGQSGDWFNISPRVIMNFQDVAATKVIQTGSTVSYGWLLSGSAGALICMREFLEPELSDNQQWQDGAGRNKTVARAIEKTLSYLNLGSLMSMVLAGVAISMASLRYSQNHMKQVALLRCFGATKAQILQLYLSGLLLLGTGASVVGALLGYLLQPVLLLWLGGLLPELEPGVQITPFFISIATGLILLVTFASGAFWQLRLVSAMSLFRNQHHLWQNNAIGSYVLALLVLTILSYGYTGSLKITGVTVLSCLGFIAVAILFLRLCFVYLPKNTARIPLQWRFGVINIGRHFSESALQVIGIGLALTTMLSLFLVKNHLINDWQRQLPADAPNYFIINMEPDQVADVKQLLQQHHVSSTRFYPMVRGRLVAINGESVVKRFGVEAQSINALQRELNLSWTQTLPETNTITEGLWLPDNPDTNWVSVDKNLARQLGLKRGDILSFQIGGMDFKALVTSFREIDWGSMKPNFFMLFKPGSLAAFPQTVITSMYLPPDKTNLLMQLNQIAPNVSVIDIASALRKVQAIFDDASNAISLLTIFSLFSGLIIVMLSMVSLNATKQQETRLLKLFGMRRNTLIWVRVSEAILLGLFTGVLAVGSSLGLVYYLAHVVLEVSFSMPWSMVFATPIAIITLMVIMQAVLQNRQYQMRFK